jgi:hypothetical protein
MLGGARLLSVPYLVKGRALRAVFMLVIERVSRACLLCVSNERSMLCNLTCAAQFALLSIGVFGQHN